ncbi:MAG: cysteine desulfurase NifS [Elusimicrobiaceae bacterium]|nr:cysteine desulfurase NifS [Elusimicrobiaceae bacterium]
MKLIYLDNNATTPVAPAVFDAMKPYFVEKYGNASSMYPLAAESHKAMEAARQQVADLVGAAHADEIIFTGCATESDNTAIFSAVRSFPNKKHIITSAVEHPAIFHPLHYLESQGYKVDYIGVDTQGRFNMDQYKAALRDDTALVTVMWANNETGTIFPVEEIAALAKARGALFHTDGVQVIGKMPLDVKNTQIDMLSLSGHKFNAPKGVGALYVRRGTRFTEFMMGGHQEKARRGGTENIPYIVGLGKAAELARTRANSDALVKMAALRDRLQNGLLTKIPDSKLNGDPQNRVPNTVNISFGYVEGESILMHLNEYGICASSGSACTSGSLEPSHVMRAMGVDFQFAHGSVRFSLSEDTTQAEVDKVIEVLPGIIENLRKISPFSRLKK